MSITGKSAAEMMAGILVKPTAAELRESREREAHAERDLLAVGTIWQRNDPDRDEPLLVKVVEVNSRWIGVRHLNGNSGNRLFYPERSRFGGTKRGNYAFVRAETIG